jgi:hypothetical protein
LAAKPNKTKEKCRRRGSVSARAPHARESSARRVTRPVHALVQAGCCRHRPPSSAAAATATAPRRSHQPSPSRKITRGAGGDRGSHCSLLAEASSPRGPRLARAEIPSECSKPSHFSTDPSKRACGSRAGIQSELVNESHLSMRSCMPGAVDIDPIAARQWRRRPPPRRGDRAGHRHRHREI